MQENRPDTTLRNTHKQLTTARQILSIRLQKNQYAIDLIFVECVLPLTALQPIANSADYLMGLMDYRGKNIPVIDLGLWLGMKSTESYNLDTPIIVCRNGHKQTAFVVSDVLQVEVTDSDSIKTKSTFEESNANFEATVNLKSHKALLFDMKHILSCKFYHQ
jgi:purine-binding chemotaxis protein CheW